MQKIDKKLVVILGQTGSGKTDIAIKLAKRFNGEIVCSDSRQVYKEMIIGTASPLLYLLDTEYRFKKDRQWLQNQYPLKIKGIFHYLFNLIKPDSDFNVGLYKKLAIKIIKEIQKKGKIPFLVGGSGLYIKSIVHNLEFPKLAANKRLRGELEKKNLKELFKIYQGLDKKGANIIDKKNKRRLIRAVEVCLLTKKPFIEQRKKGRKIFETIQIGIKIKKGELKKRIEKRTDLMLKLGLENEVKNLAKKYGFNLPSMQTICYHEWKNFFHLVENRQEDYNRSKKKFLRKEIKQRIILDNLQYAKRQMTWFKKDRDIFWVKNYQQAKEKIKKFLKIKD